jgi:hypothetical protein
MERREEGGPVSVALRVIISFLHLVAGAVPSSALEHQLHEGTPAAPAALCAARNPAQTRYPTHGSQQTCRRREWMRGEAPRHPKRRPKHSCLGPLYCALASAPRVPAVPWASVRHPCPARETGHSTCRDHDWRLAAREPGGEDYARECWPQAGGLLGARGAGLPWAPGAQQRSRRREFILKVSQLIYLTAYYPLAYLHSASVYRSKLPFAFKRAKS